MSPAALLVEKEDVPAVRAIDAEARLRKILE